VKLTVPFVARARALPGNERTLYFDEDLQNFALMVTRNGARRFVLQYRLSGRSRRLTFKPGLTLNDARRQARQLLGEVAKGRDPLDERRKKEMAAANTVAAIADEYLRRGAKGLRSVKQRRALLERLVFPQFGTRQIGSIRRSEVVRLLDRIEDENGAAMADAVLAVLRRLFNWHAARSDDFGSPIVPGLRKIHSRPRERTLSDQELRAIWRATEAPGLFNSYVRFLILTATRRNEAAAMRRDELVGNDWTVPAPRMKNATDHTIPLSNDAKAIIDAMPVLGEFVFTADGGRPMRDFDGPKRSLEQRSGVIGWRLHDLRRTARSLMSRGGVPPDIGERALAHKIVGVRGVYDRHAFFEEKQRAFQMLAQQVRQIVDPRSGDVLPMRGGV
jgi:integrase